MRGRRWERGSKDERAEVGEGSKDERAEVGE